GVRANREFLAAKPATLLESVQLNVVAPLRLAHHCGSRLATRGRGGLLLVSSLMGVPGVPYMADYAAAKAFILSLGEALHSELYRRGVRVTVLLPGPVDTPMLDELGLMPSDLPMRPMSTESCVAEVLAALASGTATRAAGRMNRVMTSLIPRSLTVKMLGDMPADCRRVQRVRRAPGEPRRHADGGLARAAHEDPAVQAADGMDVPLGVLGRRRVQLRLQRLVHRSAAARGQDRIQLRARWPRDGHGLGPAGGPRQREHGRNRRGHVYAPAAGHERVRVRGRRR